MEKGNKINDEIIKTTGAKKELLYEDDSDTSELPPIPVEESKCSSTKQEQKKEENLCHPEEMKESELKPEKEEKNMSMSDVVEIHEAEEDISGEQLNGNDTTRSDTTVQLNLNILEDNIEIFDSNEMNSNASSSSSNASGSSVESNIQLNASMRVTDNDIQAVYLTRNMLEMLIHLPTFSELVVGCVVKVLGPRPDNYKVVDIIGVSQTSSTYLLGSVETNLGLLVRHGAKQTTFRMEYLSNQDVSKLEIVIWGLAANEASIPISKKQVLMQKAIDIKTALTEFHQLNEAGELTIPENVKPSCSSSVNIAKQKTVLQKKSEALGNCDIELVDAIEEEIGLLDEQSAKQDELRTGKLNPINLINFRHRQMNSDTIPTDVADDNDMYEAGPFTRKPTNPCIKAPKSMENVEEKSADTPIVEPSNKKLRVNPEGAELYALHNFDVNIEIDSTPPPNLGTDVSP